MSVLQTNFKKNVRFQIAFIP